MAQTIERSRYLHVVQTTLYMGESSNVGEPSNPETPIKKKCKEVFKSMLPFIWCVDNGEHRSLGFFVGDGNRSILVSAKHACGQEKSVITAKNSNDGSIVKLEGESLIAPQSHPAWYERYDVKLLDCYSKTEMVGLKHLPMAENFEVTVGENVYFAGRNINHANEFYLHKGRISSVQEFDGITRFSIDGTAIAGFSGSPVVIKGENEQLSILGIVLEQGGENLKELDEVSNNSSDDTLRKIGKVVKGNLSTGIIMAIDITKICNMVLSRSPILSQKSEEINDLINDSVGLGKSLEIKRKIFEKFNNSSSSSCSFKTKDLEDYLHNDLKITKTTTYLAKKSANVEDDKKYLIKLNENITGEINLDIEISNDSIPPNELKTFKEQTRKSVSKLLDYMGDAYQKIIVNGIKMYRVNENSIGLSTSFRDKHVSNDGTVKRLKAAATSKADERNITASTLLTNDSGTRFCNEVTDNQEFYTEKFSSIAASYKNLTGLVESVAFLTKGDYDFCTVTDEDTIKNTGRFYFSVAQNKKGEYIANHFESAGDTPPPDWTPWNDEVYIKFYTN